MNWPTFPIVLGSSMLGSHVTCLLYFIQYICVWKSFYCENRTIFVSKLLKIKTDRFWGLKKIAQREEKETNKKVAWHEIYRSAGSQHAKENFSFSCCPLRFSSCVIPEPRFPRPISLARAGRLHAPLRHPGPPTRPKPEARKAGLARTRWRLIAGTARTGLLRC